MWTWHLVPSFLPFTASWQGRGKHRNSLNPLFKLQSVDPARSFLWWSDWSAYDNLRKACDVSKEYILCIQRQVNDKQRIMDDDDDDDVSGMVN